MSTFDDYSQRRKETLQIMDRRAAEKRKQEIDLQMLRNVPQLEDVKVNKQIANWTTDPMRQKDKLATIEMQNRPEQGKVDYAKSNMAHRRALSLVEAQQAPQMLEARTLADYYKTLAGPGSNDLAGGVRSALGIGAGSTTQPQPGSDVATLPAAPAGPRPYSETAFTPTLLGPLPNVSSLATPMVFQQDNRQAEQEDALAAQRRKRRNNMLTSFATPMS